VTRCTKPNGVLLATSGRVGSVWKDDRIGSARPRTRSTLNVSSLCDRLWPPLGTNESGESQTFRIGADVHSLACYNGTDRRQEFFAITRHSSSLSPKPMRTTPCRIWRLPFTAGYLQDEPAVKPRTRCLPRSVTEKRLVGKTSASCRECPAHTQGVSLDERSRANARRRRRRFCVQRGLGRCTLVWQHAQSSAHHLGNHQAPEVTIAR